MSFSESDLQNEIVKLIEDDKISSHIEGQESIFDLDGQKEQENMLPNFSIDHLVRKNCIEAASYGLKSLGLLEILTIDLNVSVTPGEVLRPDIVCFNPESKTIVIFELKKSNQTGRQALTELLAYEQEIKNILPFYASYDIVFVLISTEWSTLLDHSVASAVSWSGKQLLCLHANYDNNKLTLSPRIPSAWYVTGSSSFPPNSLPCVTYCLYDYTPSGDSNLLDNRLFTAINLIAREGDRIGGHGFVLLWQDYANHSQCDYNITLVGISPFAFFKAMRQSNILKSDQGWLVKALDKVVDDFDPDDVLDSIFKAAEEAKTILSEISDPTYEGFMDWEAVKIDLSLRAKPITCEFWGIVGNYARYYTTHPTVRKQIPSRFNQGKSDWTDPYVGISLLESFLAQDLFPDGNVRCSDSFKLGVLFGLDIQLRDNYEQQEQNLKEQINCRFTWNIYQLSTAFEEVQLLYQAAKNVNPPQEPYTLSTLPKPVSQKNLSSYLSWLKTEFLQESPIQCVLLNLGFEGAIVFDRAMASRTSPLVKEKYLALLEPKLKQVLKAILSALLRLKDEGELSEEMVFHNQVMLEDFKWEKLPLKSKIDNEVNQVPVSAIFESWTNLLNLADLLFEPVFHIHEKIASIKVDWAWIQQGIEEMYKRGEKYPAVQLLANGTLTTGALQQKEMLWLQPINDPKTEVYFADQSSGLLVVVKMNWDDLKAKLNESQFAL